MSQREPMTDASLQQFLDDFIDSLAMLPEDGCGDNEGTVNHQRHEPPRSARAR